jgi:DNA polymerase sigma
MCLAYLQFRGEPEFLADFISGLCNFYGNEFNFTLTGIDVQGNGRFFSRYHEGKLHLESPSTLYIRDPLNPENVLGHNSFKIVQVKQIFSKTHQQITEGKFGELFEQFTTVMSEFETKRKDIADYARDHGLA